MFWRQVSPLFSDKHFIHKKITLIEDDNIISNDIEVANTFNAYFTSIVEKLDIKGFISSNYSYDCNKNVISNILLKYRTHPSVIKIKENVKIGEKFHFSPVNDEYIRKTIESLDTKKPTTYNNIPTKIIVENADIFSPILTMFCNQSSESSSFPDSLKHADVTPVFKKDNATLKDNYRPVSILPSVSKIFEKNMYDQI